MLCESASPAFLTVCALVLCVPLRASELLSSLDVLALAVESQFLRQLHAAY